MNLRTNCVLTAACLALVLGVAIPSAHAVDPIHQWSFNNNLLDTSGSGNDGTYSGDLLAPTYLNGAFGRALDLKATEGITDDSPANLPLGGGDAWTMNVWYKLDAAPPGLGYLAGFGNHNEINDDLVNGGFLESNQSRAYLNFGAGYYFWGFNSNLPNPDIDSGSAYIADGEWHMYTIANDGTNISMYADGSLLVSSVNNLIDTTFNQVQVGNPSIWTDQVASGVDEFAIFDSALDLGQIAGLFRANDANVPEPGTLALVVLGLGIAAGIRRKR